MDGDLNAKVAYIRGLMTGMEFDPDSKNGKVIAAIVDVLEAMADEVTTTGEDVEEIYDELEEIEQDFDDLVGAIFDLDDEDDPRPDGEGEDDEYEVTCPNCGAVTAVDEDTLMNGELVCPACGAAFEIELAADEKEPDEK